MVVAHNRARGVKVMRRKDRQKMSFPSCIMGHVWSEDADGDGAVRDFGVVDRHGYRWDLRGRLRVDQNGNRRPEVYGDEWWRFVRNQGLCLHDKLTFYRNPNGDNPLFGVTLSLAAMIPLFGMDTHVPGDYEDED